MLTAIARMLGMQITQLSMSSAEPKKTESIDSGIGLVDTPSPKVDSDEDVFFDDDEEEIDIDAIEVDTSDLTDASVKILPGVRHMLDSIPHGKWCVATSGAVRSIFAGLDPRPHHARRPHTATVLWLELASSCLLWSSRPTTKSSSAASRFRIPLYSLRQRWVTMSNDASWWKTLHPASRRA
jgi:hypothetical protein